MKEKEHFEVIKTNNLNKFKDDVNKLLNENYVLLFTTSLLDNNYLVHIAHLKYTPAGE